MLTPTVSSIRLLPDGPPPRNRLLAALPAAAYARLQKPSWLVLCNATQTPTPTRDSLEPAGYRGEFMR